MAYFYITGCARSGTTLLQYIMKAFENMHIVPGEKFIDYFAKEEIQSLPAGDNVVLKRNAYCLGGVYPRGLNTEDEEEIIQYRKHFLKLIRMLNLRLVDIIRDPRDVITSVHHQAQDTYWVDFPRWYRQYEEINWFKKHWDKILRIRYEDLLRDPDSIQSKISDFFQLTSRHSLSNFPGFLSDCDIPEEQRRDMKGLRSLEPSRIGRWSQTAPERVFQTAKEFPQLQEALEKLGYESDESWMNKK
ncbi:MAG: sulfotransferase [bacterium]